MCIIAAKPAGIDMPSTHTIENMWYINRDGAGIMYALDGKVHIEKGFMKLDDFLAALKRIGNTVDLKNTGVVMHFRIATHGGTVPSNTHPFPISDSIPVLQKLKCTTSIGVAHNGVIDISPRSKDISDTMEYIASQLAPLSRALPKFYRNKNAMLLVKNAITSKMVFLNGEGELYTIGDFEEDKGILYSNHSYEDWYASFRYGSFMYWDKGAGHWGEYDDDYDDDPMNSDMLEGAGADRIYELPEDGSAYITPHYLMPVALVDGAYLLGENGEAFEDQDFMYYIDSFGDVWCLDDYASIAYRDPSCRAVTAERQPLAFSFDDSERIDCYEEV